MKIKFLLIIMFTLFLFSCNKEDFKTSEVVSFGNDNTVNLSSSRQDIELKASQPRWQMSLGYNDDGFKIEGDTINGEWYTLIKKNNGESLFMKVDKNEGEKRSLVISINNVNYYTRVILNQEGK